MKNKVLIKSKADFTKWVSISNLLAKSLIPYKDALNQFNALSSTQRINIKKAFDKCDKIRRIKIPKGEDDSAWEISIMVDAHIIATEYNIDPLTAMMCVAPICKPNERIYIK